MVIFHGELLVITRWYSLFRSLIRALQMDRSQAFSGPLERMERHWEYLGITAFHTLRISNMAPDRGRSWETHRNTRIISRCLGPTKTYQKHNKTIKNHQKPSKKTCFFRFKPWPTAPFFFRTASTAEASTNDPGHIPAPCSRKASLVVPKRYPKIVGKWMVLPPVW